MMLSLDEAIKHCKEVAKKKETTAIGYSCYCEREKKAKCLKVAEEHRQLAEWLKELKQLREQTDKVEESNFDVEQYEADLKCAYDCGYNCGYADAMIDIAEGSDSE